MTSSNRPFPWHAQVVRFIHEYGAPDLSGSRLMIASDSRAKDGYVIDSVVCTNERNFLKWAERSEQIRQHHPLDDHGLHYKSLRYGSSFWNALWPSLHSACLMEGVAVVMRTEKQLIDSNIRIVQELISQGLSSTNHDWKAKSFTEMVGIAGLVGAIVGAVSSPSQGVHWISDHEPAFGKSDQFQDVLNFIGRASGISTPHELGRTSVSTPLLVKDHPLWARDFVAIVDLFAGGVGDALQDASVDEDTGRAMWEPGENERRSMKSGIISNWFWLDSYTPLKRLAIDVQLSKDYGHPPKLSVSWVKSMVGQP